MISVSIGAVSDTGKLRAANEDSFVSEQNILAVADGMGGHNAGEVASAMAVQLLRAAIDHLTQTPDALANVVTDINSAIFAAATSTTEQRGMGTTITAMAISGAGVAPPQVVIANVGDSRTYLVRAGELRQISIDHSYVQELVTQGVITFDDARTHPRRNIVTRALGIDATVSVDSWTLPVFDRDRYILCSDGLVDEISNDEILAISVLHSDPQQAAVNLVAAANSHGGRDNITVIVADFNETDSPAQSTTESADPTPIAVAAPQKPRSISRVLKKFRKIPQGSNG